tara:strand:+ start:825 stop:2063 length:1239 start_codon:yes stop_codon:yes gene_type:complete
VVNINDIFMKNSINPYSALGQTSNRLSAIKSNAPGGVYAKPVVKVGGKSFGISDAQKQESQMLGNGQAPTPSTPTNATPNSLGQNLLNFATSGRGGAFGEGVLAKSGNSLMPVSFSEALSSGMQSMNTYDANQATAQAKKDQFEKEYNLKLQKIILDSNSPTNLMKNIMSAGIDPKSPEGQKIITDFLTKPESSVNIDQKTESAIDVKKYELGSTLVKENRKVIQENRNINSKLEVMKSMIEDGSIPDTNRFSEIKKSISQGMNAMGMLSETEQDELAGLESFDALVSYMVPRMRAVGSGSTSDFEAAMYKTAAPNLKNTPQGNLRIIAGFQQFNDYNIRYTNSMDKWLSKNNNLDGFEEDWVANNGDGIFHSYSNQEEMENLVSSGKLKKNQYVKYVGEDGISTVEWWDGS